MSMGTEFPFSIGGTVDPSPYLPYDPLEGQPLPVLVVDDREAIGLMTVKQLLDVVPDPVASETATRVATDPVLAEYAALRNEVQRLVEGAKKRNAVDYGRYITGGLRNERPWMVPPITLWHPEPLKAVRFPGGMTALILPYGDFLVAIDGETQRIAWQYALSEVRGAAPRRLKVVIHHDKTVEEARQGFYDLNTREVKPNTALSISMDTLDPATKITRALMEASEVLRDGGVNLRRRQLRKSDAAKVTISALRSGVVTTLLGAPGLQAGARPVELPMSMPFEVARDAVVDVWTAILDQYADEFEPENRQDLLISAPSILAGIGVVAHHTMPDGVRRDVVDEWTIEELLDKLEDVSWSKKDPFPWENIAGKVNREKEPPSFSVGGPKEVGYAIADALEDDASDGGRRIRGRPARPTRPTVATATV
jgi:hypothetical protein